MDSVGHCLDPDSVRKANKSKWAVRTSLLKEAKERQRKAVGDTGSAGAKESVKGETTESGNKPNEEVAEIEIRNGAKTSAATGKADLRVGSRKKV